MRKGWSEFWTTPEGQAIIERTFPPKADRERLIIALEIVCTEGESLTPKIISTLRDYISELQAGRAGINSHENWTLNDSIVDINRLDPQAASLTRKSIMDLYLAGRLRRVEVVNHLKKLRYNDRDADILADFMERLAK